jgi:hypothetical protein
LTNARTFSNIVIWVSDGTATATPPAFSIVVSAPSVGSATLSWTAPTQNTDGTAFTNLAGYKVRCGNSTTSLSLLVDVAGPTITSATIEGLTSGTWYFAMSSYTSTGVESARRLRCRKRSPERARSIDTGPRFSGVLVR